MKQTIKVPEDCEAKITREGDNIIVEITPINKGFKVGDWVMNDKYYMFVMEIDKDLLYVKTFNSNDMEYLGEGYTYDYLCKPIINESANLALMHKRSLMLNDKFELVPWRANSGCEYEYLTWTQQVCKTIDLINADSSVYKSGNYFSEGFITEERLNEYKETVQMLFNKWRGLKQN